MIQVRNDSYFPLSVYLESADTSIDEQKPPRGTYPRAATMLGSAGMFYMMDDPIDMHKTACGNLTGEADFIVRYGHKGKEKYTLHVKGNLSVSMDGQGVVRGIWFNHAI